MNGLVATQNDLMQRKQRLETLQNARQRQPTDSVAAARIDSKIAAVRAVIRLLEYRETGPAL